MSATPPQGTVLKAGAGSKSLYKTSNPFEQQIGYYRGVRHGSLIWISGTTAVDLSSSSPTSAPQIQYPGDAKRQTRVAFEECIRAIEALGGDRQGVVRVRMFVSRHADCGVVGEVFREFFARDEGTDNELGAAATMIVVRDGFVNKDMLVEVEMDAMAG
jgi:NET1-associated nuclear protein 1 (U3 small nucleolar RNA-associated protein 17)